MAQLWTSFGQAPGNSDLDNLLQGLVDRIKVETTNYSDVWRCGNCGMECQPSRNLLVTLPAFKCNFCLKMNPTTYAWKITETRLNGWSLDFPVYDQGPTGRCSLYASAGAVDCARKIQPAIHGNLDPAPFDMEGLAAAYKAHTNVEVGSETKDMGYEHCDNIPIVLTVFQQTGIPYNRMTAFDVADPNEERLRIKGYFRVLNDSVDLMRRLIASGFPLVTFIRVSCLFRFVNAKEVYLSPLPTSSDSSHSIVLIGCGVADRNGKAETYFFARNSHGLHAHCDHQKHGYGGDFCVLASDVIRVWGFHL